MYTQIKALYEILVSGVLPPLTMPYARTLNSIPDCETLAHMLNNGNNITRYLVGYSCIPKNFLDAWNSEKSLSPILPGSFTPKNKAMTPSKKYVEYLTTAYKREPYVGLLRWAYHEYSNQSDKIDFIAKRMTIHSDMLRIIILSYGGPEEFDHSMKVEQNQLTLQEVDELRQSQRAELQKLEADVINHWKMYDFPLLVFESNGLDIDVERLHREFNDYVEKNWHSLAGDKMARVDDDKHMLLKQDVTNFIDRIGQIIYDDEDLFSNITLPQRDLNPSNLYLAYKGGEAFERFELMPKIFKKLAESRRPMSPDMVFRLIAVSNYPHIQQSRSDLATSLVIPDGFNQKIMDHPVCDYAAAYGGVLHDFKIDRMRHYYACKCAIMSHNNLFVDTFFRNGAYFCLSIVKQRDMLHKLVQLACVSNNDYPIKLIVDTYGADFLDVRGKTLLMCVIEEDGSDQMINYIMKKGLNVDARDSNGNTALMHACMMGRKDAVKSLINQKANLSLRNHEGQRAYDLIKDNSLRNLVRPTISKSSPKPPDYGPHDCL